MLAVMAIATRPPGEAAAEASPAARPHRLTDTAFVALGLAFLVLAGRHGSGLWPVFRLTLVFVTTVAAIAGNRRWRPVGRGTVAVALGLVGTTTGLGIGLMHMVKSDLGVVAVAGVAALCAGLLLLITGTTVLVRAIPGWWRLLALPVASSSSSSSSSPSPWPSTPPTCPRRPWTT